MISKSAKDTIELGARLAKKLSAGDVIALCGDLGSGKTTFTKGIGRGLGVKEYIYGDGVTVIEWAEKIKEILPENCIIVKIKVKGECKRKITIS